MDQDRRTSGGQRVPFEALVVVASQKGGAGAYECEAVDVSERGMHLRTAYLPEVGQPLQLRFDAGSGEVLIEGEVAWREEQAKGGEFGVKFLKLDGAALASLRELSGLAVEQDGPTPQARVSRGSRVRLHIEGLASPMRARVRDDHTGEVLVGSNLDFLKVGKTLELEDVEHGKKRAALVDKVEVEVDPNSKVPQLVVTLRYDEASKDAIKAAGKPSEKVVTKVSERAPASIKAATADSKGSRVNEPRADAGERPGKEASVKAEDSHREEGEEAHEEGGKGRQMLAEIGPKLVAFGASAKVAVGSLLDRIRARREEPVDEETPARRVTAPPPDGGLRSQGRRLSRGTTEESVENHNEEMAGLEETDEETLKTRKKQRLMIAAGAGVLAILLVVFGVRARSSSPPPGAEASATGTEVIAPVAALGAPPVGAVGSGDAVSANVPLFGTTPLSTTEPAQMPGAAPKPPVGAPPTLANAGAQDDGEGDDKGEPGGTEYGKGDVKKPRTVRIKMDAPITELKGSSTGNTITVFLPGRRNVEPASTLAKRDKRLSAVKAVPKDGGLEVSLAFKDNTPPFLAKANGKMLEIDLGEAASKGGDDDGGEPTASTKKKGKKQVAKNADKKGGKDKKTTAQKKKGDKKAKKKAKKSDD